jgi:TANFOR domain-containing protein
MNTKLLLQSSLSCILGLPVCKIKSIATTLLIFISTSMALAQNDVSVNIRVLPPYPVRFADYTDNPNKILLMVRNHTQRPLSIYLDAIITGENGIEIRTAPQFRSSKTITLGPLEIRQLNTEGIQNLFDLDKLILKGISREEIISRNGLPEGFYTICGRAYDSQTGQPLSAEEPMGCSNPMWVTNIEPPIFIRPMFDLDTLAAQNPQNLLFTWSFPAGAPPSTEYIFTMVEMIDPNRNPNDVFLSQAPFFEETTNSNAFLYGSMHPTLIPGRKYAYAVTARDPANRVVFRNFGRSEIRAFVYGETGVESSGIFASATPGVCSCTAQLPQGRVNNSNVATGSKVKVGFYEMTIVEVSATADKLSGKGIISFPVSYGKRVPIQVNFTELQVNEANEALAGSVVAGVSSSLGFIPAAVSGHPYKMTFSESDIQQLDQYFTTHSGQLVSNINTSGNHPGYELPLGIDKQVSGRKTVVAITGLTITPTQAKFDAATVINIPDGATKIALGARNICLDATNLCGKGALYLSSDVDIPGISMKLKGAADNFKSAVDSGTYVVFDYEGFRSLRIQAEYTFPASMLVKQSDKASQVKAKLSANTDSWSNWLADVEIEPFYLAGNTDFGFSSLGKGLYDHSTTTNPTGMPDIPGKMNIQSPDWFGFYFPQLKVDLPGFIKKSSGTAPVGIIASNIIIDQQGLSGKIAADQVLAITEGDLGGWHYSVDNININFLNNSFQSGGMAGRMVLPITGNNPNNPESQLQYTSTLSKPQGDLQFQFVIKPRDNINVPLWLAQFSLKGTSNIMVTAGVSKFDAVATLHGSMDIVGDFSPVAKVSFTAMEFQSLKVQTTAPYLSVEKFHAGLASPAKSMAGFPVSLKDIKPEIYADRAGISFNLDMNLSDIVSLPKAEVGLKLIGQLGMRQGRPDWKYDKTEVTRIAVNGPIGPVTVNGVVDFFNNDPEYGNGLRGSLQATMLAGLQMDANVLFGRTTFSYWYVDARLKLATGIVIAPPLPLSAFGFGGGAYYNLTQRQLQDPASLYNGTIQTTNLYRPSRNSAGFKATIILGISDGTTFQGAGTLEAAINPSTMAVSLIKIQVDAAMLSPLMKTENAFIKGTGLIQYDFAHQIFDAGVGVNVSLAGIIDGKGFIHFNLDAGRSQWFLKVGEPHNRNTLTLLKFASFKSYYMTGNHNISGIPPPPARVLSQLGQYKGYRNPAIGQGAGLAFGASMDFGPAELKFLIFYMRLGAGLGYDISLTKVSESCDGHAGLPGINGWYALGQWYMWAEFAFGVDVDVWFYEGRIHVAELSMAAFVSGGIPNPTWFNGYLHGRYSVLNGAVSGTMNFKVEVGEKCVPYADPFGGIPMISEVKPSGNDVSTLADAQAAFNFPIEQPFEIETMDKDGKMERKKFWLELVHIDLTRTSDNALISGKTKNRNLKFTDNNKLVTVYTDFTLEPQTNYNVSVKVKAWDITDGTRRECLHNGLAVEQTLVEHFKTGDCSKDISKVVVGTYPIENQRYFLKDESRTGFLHFSKYEDCLLDDPKYDIIVIFSTVGGSVIQEVGVRKAGNASVSYSIPNLPNETIIEFKIVKRRKINLILPVDGGKFSYKENNRYHGDYAFATVREASISGIATSEKTIPDIVLYTYYFKTSKFNTMAAKLANSQVSSTATKTGSGNVEFFSAEFGMAEGFDVFDTRGYNYTAYGENYRIGPLLYITESDKKNRWSENYIKNQLYFHWQKAFWGGYPTELSPYGIRTNITVSEALSFSPPSGPIDLLYSSVDPPLSSMEIKLLKNSVSSTVSTGTFNVIVGTNK